MYTCIVVDDELPGRKGLVKLIEKYFKESLTVLDMADSIETAVLSIEKHKPEIVFLDIEMPGQNGFRLFELIPDHDFLVIFTTAFREYAVDAFKVSAFDYLLKPISREELTKTLKRLDEHNRLVPLKSELIHMMSTIRNEQSHSNKIPVPTQNGFRMVDIKEIVFCEADENYTKIFLLNNECLLVSHTLARIQELLPDQSFFRIHKSYLINVEFIKTYNKNDGFNVILSNGKILPVAFRRNEEFVKFLRKK